MKSFISFKHLPSLDPNERQAGNAMVLIQTIAEGGFIFFENEPELDVRICQLQSKAMFLCTQ